MAHSATDLRPDIGLPVRQAAVRVLRSVLVQRHRLENAFAHHGAREPMAAMAPHDRALVRLIAATALRRKGQIDDVLARFLAKGLPKECGSLAEILLAGAAQLLFLGTPPHAAVGTAVALAKQDAKARRFDKLVNAVLRRVAEQGPAIMAGQDAARLNTPDWLWQRWSRHYSEAAARAIAESHLAEPALDLTVKADPERWAATLGGIVLGTGSVRFKPQGRIEDLPGYADGQWWVQDAAAALPARLLGDVRGKRVADLCAAPGGKTAQLAAAGARVTAVDIAQGRLERLRQNLARLGLEATVLAADATSWAQAEPFDAVLLDAPCTSTGTIRRHPDIPHLKSQADLVQLSALQARLIDNAVRLLAPGGVLVYCTCSLEPEEGEQQVARLLAQGEALEPASVAPGELGVEPAWVTGAGHLRTLPFHLPMERAGFSGLDGFFAARLRKRA